MIHQIYFTELQLNKANFFDTESLLAALDLSITNGIVSFKMNYKRNKLLLKLLIAYFWMDISEFFFFLKNSSATEYSHYFIFIFFKVDPRCTSEV